MRRRILLMVCLLAACDQQASIGERSDAGHGSDVGIASAMDASDLDARSLEPDADLVADAGTGADAETEADVDAGADAGADADTEADAGTDAGTGADANTEPPPDGGPPAGTCGVNRGTCDVVAQDCTDPEHGCYLTSEEAGGPLLTICREPNMSGGEGAACSFVNDCLPGFTCVGDGRCRRYCCTGSSSDCPVGSGQRCLGLVGAEEIGVCLPATNCDLRTSAGCDEGTACYVSGADGSVGCLPAGAKSEGMRCATINDCTSGLGCIDLGTGDHTCQRYCRISMMEMDCGGTGRTCSAVAGISLPTDIGICL